MVVLNEKLVEDIVKGETPPIEGMRGVVMKNGKTLFLEGFTEGMLLLTESETKEAVPPEVVPFLSNPYVAGFKDGKFLYKPGFHKAMFELLEAGKNAREAYDALGFDTKTLGYDRAYGAAKRAREKARTNTLESTQIEEETLAKTGKDSSNKGGSKADEPAWAEEVRKNPYVQGVGQGRIHYTDEFYAEMIKLADQGFTATEAYEKLGFDVETLGKDRAYQALAYAKKTAMKRSMPVVGTNGADGTISFQEAMKQLNVDKMDPYNPMLAAAAYARVLYLETILDGLKKKLVEIGGQVYELEDSVITANIPRLVAGVMGKGLDVFGLSVEQVLNAFSLSPSTYYGYTQRQKALKDSEKKRAEEVKKAKDEDKAILREIIEIVQIMGGNCPGVRPMRIYLATMFGRHIGKKRCSKLMRRAHFIGNRHWQDQRKEAGGKNDPYKGQAKHCHVALALENKVDQDFFRGPYEVILTDITYLPYKNGEECAYHCQFFDPFMNRTLGEYTSMRMDVGLVKAAYEDMMKKHGEEIKKVARVYIHSDAGSQYTATSFKQLLENEGFVQSMSRRANPTDNAPMEARFSRLKDAIGDLVYICKDFESVRTLVSNYLVHHDEHHVYLCLAGLTPNQFYDYWRTGIYPLDEYFGVDKEHFSTPEQILEYRKKRASEEAAKRKERYERYKDKMQTKQKRLVNDLTPLDRVILDLQIVTKEEEDTKERAKKLTEVGDKLTALKGKILKAWSFVKNASEEVLEQLKDVKNWCNYAELSYVKDMTELGLC